MTQRLLALLLLGAAPAATGAGPSPDGRTSAPPEARTPLLDRCHLGWERTPPDYYTFQLHPTGALPSARNASGRAEVSMDDSPFDVALTPEGRFRRRVTVHVEGVRTREGETLVAWVAPPDLEPLVRLGALDAEESVSGVVGFNKFLAFVTVEPADRTSADRWSGPILLRGMSRSGRLQSMASHGMFEPEPC